MVSIPRKSTDSENCLQNELKQLQHTTSYDHRQHNNKNTKAQKRHYNNRCYNIRINMPFCGDANRVDKNVKNIKKVKIQKYRKWRSLISGFNVVFLIVIVAPFYFNGLFCQGKIFNWIFFFVMCKHT